MNTPGQAPSRVLLSRVRRSRLRLSPSLLAHFALAPFTLALFTLALLSLSLIASGCAERTPPDQETRTELSQIDSLLTAGDSVYSAQPDSAAVLWARAHRLASAQRDSTRVAHALTRRSQAARQLGQPDSARVWGEQALAIKHRLGMTEHLFRSLNALGLLAWQEDRTSAAESLFMAAANAARATGDDAGLAKSRMNQALVLQEQARFTEARTRFLEAQTQFEQLADSFNLARTLNNRAALEIAWGQPLAAMPLLASARALARRTGDSTVEANARGQLAVAWAAIGEPQRAFAMIDSAIALSRAMGARPEVAENLRVLADLYLDAGDTRHALDSYRAATALQDSLGYAVERGTLLRQQARALLLEGNLAGAQQLATRALAVHDSAGATAAAFDDILLLLTLATHRADGRVASRPTAPLETPVARQLAMLDTLATRLGTPLARARVALAGAAVSVQAKDWRRALTALASSSDRDALVGPDERAEWHQLRAQAFAGMGNGAQAVSEARTAVNLVDEVRARHTSGELRARYTEARARVYAELTLALLRRGDVAEAFAVADAARGRALVERLGAARTTATPDARDADLLLRRIDALVQRLRLRETTPLRDRSAALLASTGELRDSLRALRSEYEALHARTRAMPGAGGAIMSPAQVQRVLEPQELLVEYLATPSRLVVFLLTRTEVRTLDVPVASDSLAVRISLVRALLQPPHDAHASRALLGALHRDLLGPVWAAAGAMTAGKSRLIVIPHGLLAALPFAALRDTRRGRHVVEDWSVLQVPSAATLVALRTGESVSRPAGIHAFAPLTARLPATRSEVRTVAALAQTTAVRTYEDADATESRVRDAVRDSMVLHVASHAIVNGHNPLFSRLDLTPDATNDGRLEVHEILTLNVRAPLVFLSGCETALGNVRTTRFETRDEFTSLAHAWLLAGARTVVATLWRIDDRAAAVFAGHFYAALRTMPAPEALATAQRAMLADPITNRPYLWAAYQVQGTH